MVARLFPSFFLFIFVESFHTVSVCVCAHAHTRILLAPFSHGGETAVEEGWLVLISLCDILLYFPEIIRVISQCSSSGDSSSLTKLVSLSNGFTLLCFTEIFILITK